MYNKPTNLHTRYLSPLPLTPFDNVTPSRNFAENHVCVLFRQQHWLEAEADLDWLPRGTYAVFWYFQTKSYEPYDETLNPLDYPTRGDLIRIPSLPNRLRLSIGPPGDVDYSHGRDGYDPDYPRQTKVSDLGRRTWPIRPIFDTQR